jgi:hypothetical protein
MLDLASHILKACDHYAIASLQTRLHEEFLRERKGRDIPKRRTRSLRLALVCALPMCVPGLRPPAVSWVHDCELQTESRLEIVLMADLVLNQAFTAIWFLCAKWYSVRSCMVCAWLRGDFSRRKTRAERVSRAASPSREQCCCDRLVVLMYRWLVLSLVLSESGWCSSSRGGFGLLSPCSLKSNAALVGDDAKRMADGDLGSLLLYVRVVEGSSSVQHLTYITIMLNKPKYT